MGWIFKYVQLLLVAQLSLEHSFCHPRDSALTLSAYKNDVHDK